MTAISAGSSVASWRRSRPAARPRSAAMSSSAAIAAWSAAPTIPAATGIARSARAWRAPNGWRRARPNCCRCRTSMSSSPCRRRRPRSRSRTRRWSTPSCSSAAAEALRTVAADPRHLGAEIGAIAVLHTWGQTLHHHPAPALHRSGRRSLAGSDALGAVPARVLPAGARAVAALPRPVPGTAAGGLRGRRACASPARLPLLAEPDAFAARLATLRGIEWVVYAKPPIRRARAGARLSRPLHPPRRHRQQPAEQAVPTARSASAGRTTATTARPR